MSSWLWVIMILLVGFGALIFYNSRRGESNWLGRIGVWLSRLFSPVGGGPDTIARLQDAKRNVEEENADLEAMLEAKKELAEEKAKRNKLRRQIAAINERNVDKSRAGRPR